MIHRREYPGEIKNKLEMCQKELVTHENVRHAKCFNLQLLLVPSLASGNRYENKKIIFHKYQENLNVKFIYSICWFS